MPKPVDKDLVMALKEICRQTALIRENLPRVGVDDILLISAYRDGKVLQIAQSLMRLNQRRTPPVDLEWRRKG
jgi:hypothetical protein